MKIFSNQPQQDPPKKLPEDTPNLLIDIVRHRPPPPYLTWTEGAIKSVLRKAGFDFTRPIQRKDSKEKGLVRFWQEKK